jgi:hypothetical protein
MQRSPDPHVAALRHLVQRFSAQEQAMTAVLQALHAELELCCRETAFLRLGDAGTADDLMRRCSELQFEADCLATELVHVRLAVSGAGEELADRLGRTSQHEAPWPGRPTAMLA